MTTPRILIVEDEVIIAEHITSSLEEFGYSVCGRIGSGEEAREAVAELRPDLVLMDIRLQGPVDGIEAADIITNQYKTPVIFLTAHADRSLLERAKRVRPCGYLIKPIQKPLLNANVEVALYLSEVNRQRREAQHSLRVSEERWRSLTENSQDIIIELDADLTIQFLNHPLPGLSRDSIIGCKLLDLITLTETESPNPFQEALEQSNSLTCEAVYHKPDDQAVYYEVRISHQETAQVGDGRGLIVCLRDLTSIRKLSRKLLDRERWLNSTFQQAAVGIAHTDIDGQLLRVNDTYCDIMGYPEEELLGRSFLEFTDPAFREAQSEGRQQLVRGEIDIFTIEKRNLKKDGSPVWLNVSLSLVCKDDGSPEYILGIIKDVNDRKAYEQALQESEEKYRDLVEHIPQRVTYKNTDLVYVAVNQRYADDYGLKASDIEGKTDADIFPEALAAPYRADDRRVLETGAVQESEQIVQIGDQSHTFRSVKVPKRDKHGNIEGVLTVMTDITEQIESERIRKNLERDLQQTQKMQALGTLAGGVAHDFNNILHPIIGLSTLGARINEEGSTNFKYFSDIRKAGHRAKDLVSQILTFSRQGDQELKPVQLPSLVKEALKMLRASLPTTIAIETDIDERCGLVKADPTRIHQIIMNLATNGFQAMEESGGTLSVSLQPIYPQDPGHSGESDDGGELLELRIRDTGIGIPPENLKKIFDPYFTTKEVGHGTGLGLAVVIGIVESHNGTIHVESTPGEGTEITICLPVTHKTSRAEEEPKPRRKLSGNEHILVVDDEDDIVFFLQEALKHLGYKVTGTVSSKEALEWFQKDPKFYDAVITDMTMPNMTGYDLALQILEIRADTPVILCTGHSATVDEEKAVASGIHSFLPKPIDQDDLAAAIRNALDTHQ